LNICGHSPYVTSSLTRERVCRLQLLLALTSAVILKSEPRKSQDHILLSQIRDLPSLEARFLNIAVNKVKKLLLHTLLLIRNYGALVRQRTIPTERPPLVGEVNANFSG
jgi:hypothetical protein